MKSALFSLLLLIIINFVNSVTIECKSQQNTWTPFGNLDECLALNVIAEKRGEHVTYAFSNDRTSVRVYESLQIYLSPNFHYIPKSTTEYFSSDLKTLVIANSGLKSLAKDDLEQFRNLRGLYIDSCKIVTLSLDLFTHTPNIEQLLIQKNAIEIVDKGTFNPLTKLDSFSFDDNKCHSGKANGIFNVKILASEIEEKCQFDMSSVLGNSRSGFDSATKSFIRDTPTFYEVTTERSHERTTRMNYRTTTARNTYPCLFGCNSQTNTLGDALGTIRFFNLRL